NEDVVTPDNTEHLLQVMREATASELKEKHDAQLLAERAAAKEKQNVAANEIEQLAAKVRQLEGTNRTAFDLKESQVSNVVSATNRMAFRVEVGVTVLLLLLGLIGGVNFYTGVLNDSRFWSLVLFLAGIVGFARTVFAIRERSMPALATVLN